MSQIREQPNTFVIQKKKPDTYYYQSSNLTKSNYKTKEKLSKANNANEKKKIDGVGNHSP